MSALLVQVVMQYAGAQVIWCQEEPKNMGAWRYVKPRMDTAMRELMESQPGSAQPLRIRYVGRPAAASPGTFYFKTFCLSLTTCMLLRVSGNAYVTVLVVDWYPCQPCDDCKQVLHAYLPCHKCRGFSSEAENLAVVIWVLCHVCTAAV